MKGDLKRQRKVFITSLVSMSFSSIIFTLIVSQGENVWAHEGHSDAPTESAGPVGAPLKLSPQARQNLDLKIVEAEVKPIAATFQAFGEVRSLPEKMTWITSPFSGSVISVMVRTGMRVAVGQPLVELQSRALAETPVRLIIRASKSGKVLSLPIAEGASVETGTTLMEIGNLNQVLVVARVFEDRIGDVTLGQQAQITGPALARPLLSRVETVGGEVDAVRRTVDVGLRVGNPGEKLKVNMSVTVFFAMGENEDVIAIPKQAVLGQGGERFVFISEDGVFKRLPVVLGRYNESLVEVIEGVSPGDSVVVQGNYQLQFAKPTPQKGAPPAR